MCVCAHAESDHQEVVKQHCGLLMEYQGKMSEASMKFESLEEEHLAQMVTFMIKIARVSEFYQHSNTLGRYVFNYFGILQSN